MDRCRRTRGHGLRTGLTITAPSPRWVGDDKALEALLAELEGEPRVGLDTEFHRERTYLPDVALVQLGWSNGIALVDATAVDLSPLAGLLRSDTRIVMHACQQDLEVLDAACGVEPRHLFDTQIAAGFVGLSSPSLASLCKRYLGIELSKGDRLTDWKRRPLSESARAYAAADVAHLFGLEDQLHAALVDLGRLEWVADECSRVVRRTLDRPPPEQAWWRIKDARRLRGRPAAVAQSVAAWREERARRVDRPLRFVLPDLPIVMIAQREPKDLKSLQRIRGIDDRHLRGGAADELLEAIETGTQLDLGEVVHPQTAKVDRSLRPAVALVSAWISQFARDNALDPSLLATRGDLEAFLAGAPGRLDDGWRSELVAAPIRRLVAGEAALAFAGEGRLVVESRSHDPL